MIKYQKQIQRIKRKLLEARKADKNLKVFGASSHKYELNKPAMQIEVFLFEKKYSIQLPECYTAFILEVGNGGNSHAKSAAGPFYGIYPLGSSVDDLIYDRTEAYLKNDCMIYPQMSDTYWENLIKNIEENEDISDEEYEKEVGKIYGGILPIGSQGCTYLHGIVLNGPYKGRVVNVDMDRQKPQFAFESNFLDWYERWLDEVISGELIKDTPSWFGYTKGGAEDSLLTCYLTATDEIEKQDCLVGLLNKNTLKDQTLNQIEQLIKDGSEHKNILIQILCKSNYQQAKPHLDDLFKTDMCSVFQFIYWYAKEKSPEWRLRIEANMDKVQDEETFRFCTYLLRESGDNYAQLIAPFTKHENENIRVQAFYTLGQIQHKQAFIDLFIAGLNDSSNRVIHATLQALSGLKDNRMLASYKNLAEKFPEEQDHILINLNHRLAEYNLTNKTILNRDINTEKGSTDQQANKKWYQIWK